MAKATHDRTSQPSRRAFALTGPSVTLDPRTHAVRGDLADVRLAEQVFAPHYAAPLKARALHAISLFSDRNLSEPLAELPLRLEALPDAVRLLLPAQGRSGP